MISSGIDLSVNLIMKVCRGCNFPSHTYHPFSERIHIWQWRKIESNLRLGHEVQHTVSGEYSSSSWVVSSTPRRT